MYLSNDSPWHVKLFPPYTSQHVNTKLCLFSIVFFFLNLREIQIMRILGTRDYLFSYCSRTRASHWRGNTGRPDNYRQIWTCKLVYFVKYLLFCSMLFFFWKHFPFTRTLHSHSRLFIPHYMIPIRKSLDTKDAH